MYSVRRDLTPENILRLISEEDIFRHYMGNDFVIGTTNSPLRKGDQVPSFSIFVSRRSKYVLRFKDHAMGKSGSCFDFVMLKYNLTYSESLVVINNDFSLGLDVNSGRNVRAVQATFAYKDMVYTVHETIIHIIPRPFTQKDLKYWRQFNICKETLEAFDVTAVKYYWLIQGDKKRIIRSSTESPIYAYCFPNDEFKMYAPMRTDSYKWISNTRQLTIQGLTQVQKHSVPKTPLLAKEVAKSPLSTGSSTGSRLLIITKSLKDVMSLYSFGITSIAPMSESVILQPEQITMLRKHFRHIMSLMDFDKTGVHNANILRHRYGIEPLFLTNGRFGSVNYGSKDFSDYVKDNGVEKAGDLLKSLSIKI